MASRRTRIKGIANIPQRKKINQENSVSNLDPANSDNIVPDESECNITVLVKEENIDQLTQHVNINSSLDSSINSSESSEKLPCTTQNNVEPITSVTNSSNVFENSKAEVTQSFNNPDLRVTEINNDNFNIKKEIHCTEIATGTKKEFITQESQIEVTENQNPKTSVPRRKFLKPGINLNAIRKRQIPKETIAILPTIENTALAQDVIKKETLEGNEEKEIELKPPERVVVISEIRIPKYEHKSIPIARDITKIISKERNDADSDQRSLYSEVTLNETYLNEGSILNSSTVTFSPNIKKIVPETHVSDSEYPAPPPSPSKINRSRIKAIPRLSQRKTSCSASESEDETRKYGRIRNNSVCSVVSTSCLEPPTPTSETAPPKDVTPIFQKKVNRTEQSRKLAEARREFQKRFGTNSPDKQRLKMIDLIFYNPTTNPMSKKSINTSSENTTKIEKESEEIIDDPPKVDIEQEKEKENDEDNGMPVPQIKIGPSGEIILDEQSLIVENVEVARQKEQIRNSQLVNGDFDTGYGIYKRARRSLVWNQKETLRFYKALNLIGTDFTVMTQLFPKRTRRELKIKFKKEEKINKPLIDKAIMQPCNYNFTDLKREIEIEEEEEVILQKLKEEETEKIKQAQLDKLLKRGKKRREKDAESEKSLSKSIHQENELNKDTISLPLKKRLKSLLKPTKIKSQPRKTKAKSLNIKSVLDDDSDADISDMETHSESEEEETIPFLKPTRSGRMPKSTIRYTTIIDPDPIHSLNGILKITSSNETPSADSTKTFTTPDEPHQKLQYNAIRNRRSSSLSSIESNPEKLVPGSVVITVEEDSNGKLEYKVFMVTPDKKMAPLDLDSETIAKLVKEKERDENNTESVAPSAPEQNVTIPATDGNALESKPQEILLINCPDVIDAPE